MTGCPESPKLPMPVARDNKQTSAFNF